jgi:hypothetical protein
MQEHIGDFDDRELDELVKDLAELFHDREWYLSSDTGVGDWRESRDNFKVKWFGKDSRPKRIERYLDEIRAEVLDSFGIVERKCVTCNHWKKKDDSEIYGMCELETRHLWHRSEGCDKWKGDAK